MNPLTDVPPPQARKVPLRAAFVVTLCLAAYKAANGDWLSSPRPGRVAAVRDRCEQRHHQD